MVTTFLIGICEPTHSTHNSKNVVVGGVDADLGGLGALNGGVGEHKLECGVINT